VSYKLRNSVLQLTQHCLTAYAIVSYSLRNTVLQLTQHCLTNYGNNVLQLICGKVVVFPGYLKLLFTPSTPMKFEHRGETVELFLVGIHHPHHPDKIWEEARAIWKVVINGKENSGTRSGDRDEVVADIKREIDWLIVYRFSTYLHWV
jgi:hypothetical protein